MTGRAHSRRAGRLARMWLLALAALCAWSAYGQRRILPPPTPGEEAGSAWLWLDTESGRLRPFVAGSTAPQRVLYHLLPPAPGGRPPAPLRVRARGGQCFFLDNQLVFTAPVSGTYVLRLPVPIDAERPRLLAVWHPTAPADPGIFIKAALAATHHTTAARNAAEPRPRLDDDSNRNVFIVLLLLVGLLYGVLRSLFGISLSRFLRLELATRQGGEVRLAVGALPSTPLTVLFGIGFALSLALLIVVVQTDFETSVVLRNLFPPSDADLLVRVGLYAGLVVGFVLLRYVFLHIVGYVFDLTALVDVQYAAFVRTLLLAGAYIPPTILLHLVLAAEAPTVARRLSDVLLTMLLVAVAVRAVLALRTRHSLSNPHLFAYLCATEVIPFLVLFRLIVSPRF